MTPKEQLALAEKLAKREAAKRKREEKAAYDATPRGQLEKAKRVAKKKEEAEIARARHEAFMVGCKKHGLPTPDLEVVFYKGRDWAIDYHFRIGDRRVALENEGGTQNRHGISRHTSPEGYLEDMMKYNEISRMGITLIRITPERLATDYTFQLIKDCLLTNNQPCF